MGSGQAVLFEPEAFYLVPVCPECGPLGAVPVEGGVSAPWHAAECWAYIARKNHDREVHGDQ